MENKEIIEGNRIISHSDFNTYEFAELNRKPISDNFYLNVLTYHKDWNMLMPVVEKIENTWISGSRSKVTICRNFVEIVHTVGYHNTDYAKNSDLKKDNQLGGECYVNNFTKIENTYRMVVEFIKWYNENKNN